MKNRIKIETEGKTVYVKRPGRREYQKAQAISNGSFRDALDSGAILRSELDKYAEERGIWDKNKQSRLEDLNKKIEDSLLKLKRGGIKIDEARKCAIDVRQYRMERTLLLASKNQLDDYSAETQAENDRFDYLVSQCVVDENNEKAFKDLDHYREESENEYAYKSASALNRMIHNLDDNWEAELPENQFLSQYNFVNDKLQLVDKDGNLIDIDGKRINENFQYINEDGKPIDEDGNLIDEDGLPIIESSPFLDDEGNAIEIKNE